MLIKLNIKGSLAILAIVLLTMSCAPAAETTPALQTSKTKPEAVPAKLTWQQEWDKVQSEAKREGNLLIFASAGPSVRDPLGKIFAEQFGLTIYWVSGRNTELEQKVAAEHRAGIFLADVYLAGVSAYRLGEQGILQSLDPILFLPEVLDKKAWWGNDLIFVGKDRVWAAFLAFPIPYIFINTDLVKPGEARGWKDLLDPKWKGKMVLYNPRDGAGLDWAYSVSQVVMYPDYLREFARQEPVILSDSRQQTEWVARGKYPVAVGARGENMNEFKKMGAPVQIITPAEGVHLTSSAGGVAVFKNAPHRNAARQFVNWALTREGGTVLSRLIGGQSARLDVPTDFLDPTMVRQPGVKYFNTITEEHVVAKEAFPRVAMEIFGPLMK